MYKFLTIRLHQDVLHWISNNTKSQTARSRNVYTTVRNSSAVINAWRSRLPWDTAQIIQGQCAHVMQRLGYKLTESEKHYKNLTYSLVQDFDQLELGRLQQIWLKV